MAIITAKERYVMHAVYALVSQKGCGVITEDDIWELLPLKLYPKFLRKKTNVPDAQAGRFFVKDKPLSKEQIKSILQTLSATQYFELTKAVSAPVSESEAEDKKKKKKQKGDAAEQAPEQKPQAKEMFVIELKDKGKTFPRDEADRIKGLAIKIISSILFTILTFTVTMILRAIFT